MNSFEEEEIIFDVVATVAFKKGNIKTV
jgi:hypothetical protein